MQQNAILDEEKENSTLDLKSKKTWKIITIFTVFFAIIITGIITFNKKFIYNSKIAKNVYVGSVDISGLTKNNAKSLLEKKYNPKDITINYNGENFIIYKDKINLKYDLDEVVNKAYNYNKTDSYINNVKKTISLERGRKEVIGIKPIYNNKKLDKELEKICANIDQKAKDAKLEILSNGFNIIPDVDGKIVNRKITKENMEKNLSKNKFEGSFLALETKKAKVTSEILKDVNSKLASHSTTFTNASYNRAFNIIRAANSTSDILLMPGEEFSYNEATGPRSVENGYKEAPIIVNGKVQNGPGGGVCQVSTTIYNSALNSGLEITDVRNHSLASTYAPKGKDATVSDGSIDFKFKNPYKHPIYIKNFVYGGVITSEIYGNSKDKQNISIVTENAGISNVVKTYRIYKDSYGKTIKREYIATSSYRR